MNYDIIIIGAGPGGIFAAYELMQKKPDLKVAVFEAGHALNKRHCPIDGEKIKITDETDQNQGVFIVDATGTEHRVTRRLTVNKPSQIIARVPSSVPAGAVTVKIKTNYSGNKAPLSAIREISYGYECTAV